MRILERICSVELGEHRTVATCACRPWSVRLAAAVALLSLMIMTVAYLVPLDVNVQPPASLFLFDSTLFYVLYLTAAYFSARVFLGCGGSRIILLAGSAALALSASAGTSILIFFVVGGEAGALLILVLGSLVASIVHLINAVVTSLKLDENTILYNRVSFGLAYGAVLIVIALLVLLVFLGGIPGLSGQSLPLFRAASWAVVGLCFLAVIAFLAICQQRRSYPLYWYSLAIAMLGLSHLASLIMLTIGDILFWLSEIYGYLGVLFYIISTVVWLADMKSGKLIKKCPLPEERRTAR